MTNTMKYHKLQASSDDHNNNKSHEVDQLDQLDQHPDQPPPEYNQSHEFSLPPSYPRRDMASSMSSIRIRIRLDSTFESRKRVFFTLVMLCILLNAATFILMINDVFALSKLDTRYASQMIFIVGPLIQNVYNFQCFIEFRGYDNLRKHGDLLLENDQDNANQENANQDNNTPIRFWPLWIYSVPTFMIMMVVFYIHAPITMILAIGANTTVNIAFMVTVMFCDNLENTNQDFDIGLGGNILFGMTAVVLLFGGIAEKILPTPASASSAFLGAH